MHAHMGELALLTNNHQTITIQIDVTNIMVKSQMVADMVKRFGMCKEIAGSNLDTSIKNLHYAIT